MFEKKAKEYAEKVYGNSTEMDYYGIAYAFEDGAEFGYYKANEWHYPSKGSLPKDLCLVIACFWELGKKQVREVYFDSKYFCYHGNHIEPIAWQYFPVPPKEESC